MLLGIGIAGFIGTSFISRFRKDGPYRTLIVIPVAIAGIAVTLILFLTHQSMTLRMGVLGALVLFVFAQMVNLYIKTSLHVGFNTYLAFLIFPFNWVVGVGTLVFSFFLGWSRIVLKRHTLAEVVSGALLGLVVGGLMLWARGW